MNRELSDAVWTVITQRAMDPNIGYTPTYNDLPMFLFAIASDLRRIADTLEGNSNEQD